MAILGAAACALSFACAAGVLHARSYFDELSRAFHCESNLRQIGTALAKYQEAYGRIPPAVLLDSSGRPLHSWRALILPYLSDGKYAGKYRYDEPWDGPNNKKLADWSIEEFSCPNGYRSDRPGLTNYVAIVGPRTAFPPQGKGRFRKAIIDGLNDTILLAETTTEFHWSEPKDLDWETMSFELNDPQKPSLSSRDKEGVHVLKANGEPVILPSSLSPQTIKAYLTVDGEEKADPF